MELTHSHRVYDLTRIRASDNDKNTDYNQKLYNIWFVFVSDLLVGVSWLELVPTGNPYRRGKHWTVGLLIKIGCFVKIEKYCFGNKSSWFEKYKEVNGTDPSPSVRIPWCQVLRFLGYLSSLITYRSFGANNESDASIDI